VGSAVHVAVDGAVDGAFDAAVDGAVDLGATSGRVAVGELHHGRLVATWAYRFPNQQGVS
jgi:hypothetical protein